MVQVLRLRIWSEGGGSLFMELQAEAQVTRAPGSRAVRCGRAMAAFADTE